MPAPRLIALGLALSLVACQADPPTEPRVEDSGAPALAVGAGIPLHATVDFGRDDVGSHFPPPSGHDRSFHAKDKVYPKMVNIRAGGSVTFQMGTFHRVAIYEPGVAAEDIDVTLTIDFTAPPPAPPGTVIIPDFLIDDPNGRLAVGPFSFAPLTWTSPPGTFDTPGRYLVICQVVPHFVEAKMYAWVTVR